MSHYYITKKYDAVYYLVDKEIAEKKDFDYSIIDTLPDGIYHYREYTKDSAICYDYYMMSDTAYVGEFKKYYPNSKINKLIHYCPLKIKDGEIRKNSPK